MKNKLLLLPILLSCIISASHARTGARYIIICPDNFVSAVQPLADWKTKKGVKAIVVPLSITGSSASQIKSYIQNAYNTWDIRPEYILLAGHGSQIPTSGSYDDYYGDMNGTYRMELSVGRFPVTTIDQLNNIINKTISYERTPYIDDPLWYLKGTTIVREDYSGYPPTTYPDTYYWENARYCFNQWLNNGYVYIDSLSKNRGHSSTDIMNAVNDGRAYLIFRGQSTTNWWSPFAFEPNNANNGYKLPVVVSGTCATMSLSSTNYAGDKFLNAGSVTTPKGAVGFFGTTVVASGSGLAQQRGTVAIGFFQALFREQIQVMGDAAKRAKYLIDSIQPSGFSQVRYQEWNLFGDPELNLYTQTPRRFTVIYDSVIPLTQTHMLVTVQNQGSAPVQNALVCLKMDTTIYVWGTTNSQGQISLPVQSQTVGTMDVTVTGYNFMPFEGTARFIPSNAPFIVFNSVLVNDSLGNSDGKINPGENIKLKISLRNDGSATADNVIAYLYSSDASVNITDSISLYGSIATSQNVQSQTFYQFTVNPNTENSHQIIFQLRIQDDSSRTWNQQFTLTVYAGKINFSSSFINDSSPSGNSNNHLGPNESARLQIVINNIGENLSQVTGLLRCDNQYITITDSLALFGDINNGQSANNNSDLFAISASPNLPKNYSINFSISIGAQGGTYTYRENLSFSIISETGSTSDPTGPDNYGYWAYDNTDTLSGRAPTYNWYEIGPSGPGSLIDSITNRDAAVITLSLPFTFKYYGQNYDSISVCVNGFAAMGRTNYRLSNNSSIPDTAGPSAMIAPFWCDLNANENTSTPGHGDIYQYYDTTNHRWIVEFYQVAHYGQTNQQETFQIIFLDPTYYPTQTGDGEILYVYNTVANTSNGTIGIENLTETTGIQYMLNNNYNPSAATIINGRVIRFTTLPPTNLQQPWVVLTQTLISDSIGGNNNGIPEPNEIIRFASYLKNRGSSDAQNVQVVLRSLNSNAVVTDSVKTFSSIAQGQEVNNQTNPFVFTVSANPNGTNLDFQLTITTQNYSTIDYFSLPMVAYPGIDVERISQLNSILSLRQNHPNPFTTHTAICYSIPAYTSATLKIYDVTGKLIKSYQTYSGSQSVNGQFIWNRRDENNHYVSSGVYYYTLTCSNNHQETRKMVIY